MRSLGRLAMSVTVLVNLSSACNTYTPSRRCKASDTQHSDSSATGGRVTDICSGRIVRKNLLCMIPDDQGLIKSRDDQGSGIWPKLGLVLPNLLSRKRTWVIWPAVSLFSPLALASDPFSLPSAKLSCATHSSAEDFRPAYWRSFQAY
ncbi:hypothetical protein F4824DRAFT_445772 [Ustulina deusta]|nr:hypothetical protein F4824DRAFT_445772 [Ustulina deusta]